MELGRRGAARRLLYLTAAAGGDAGPQGCAARSPVSGVAYAGAEVARKRPIGDVK